VATAITAILLLGDEAEADTSPGIALIDRPAEAINARDLSKLDQVYAAGSDYTNHQTLVGAPSSVAARDMFIAYLEQRIKAFPDLAVHHDVVFASGDHVAVNMIWSGTHQGEYLDVPASSKR
jgi:predicted ester cyclase